MKSVKLIQGKRFNFDGKVYERGTKYSVKNDVAKTLLELENDYNGLPYFVEAEQDTEEGRREREIKRLEAEADAEAAARQKASEKDDEKVEV